MIIDSKIMTSITVFYYPEENLFKDSGGNIVFGMYKLIPPNMIFLFKHNKKSIDFINYKYGIIIKLLYPIV